MARSGANQGVVRQFLYGEDGGDGAWVEKQKFPSSSARAMINRESLLHQPCEGERQAGSRDARRAA